MSISEVESRWCESVGNSTEGKWCESVNSMEGKWCELVNWKVYRVSQ